MYTTVTRGVIFSSCYEPLNSELLKWFAWIIPLLDTGKLFDYHFMGCPLPSGHNPLRLPSHVVDNVQKVRTSRIIRFYVCKRLTVHLERMHRGPNSEENMCCIWLSASMILDTSEKLLWSISTLHEERKQTDIFARRRCWWGPRWGRLLLSQAV